MNVSSISVYCASSSKIDPAYMEEAYKVGQLLARAGITLINGAGNMGLMKASSDGCLEAGGRALGIIPGFMIAEGWCHQGMSEIIETPDMHIRQQKMAEAGDAAIVLPGGCGSMAELFELITWKQLGLYFNPIVILNINGYYDHFIAQLERAVEEHFMGEIHSRIWSIATTPEEAVEIIRKTPRWNESVRKYAAL